MPECVRAPAELVRLWLHECDRVYGDKLVEEKDMVLFAKIEGEICKKCFEVRLNTHTHIHSLSDIEKKNLN